MSLVADCSVALSWYLPDEQNEASAILLAYAIDVGAHVPFVFKLEFSNGMTFAMRRGRIAAQFRANAFAALDDLQLFVDAKGQDLVWTHYVELADRHRLTLYDASYLELAIRLGLPLATFDKALAAAAGRENLRLV